jgi:hypothetical protein
MADRKLPNHIKIILTFLVLFQYYEISTWKYALAAGSLILAFRRYDQQDFRETLGLVFQPKELLGAIAVFALSAGLTEVFIQYSITPIGTTKELPEILGTWFLRPFFQAFNEEILVRPLLFGLMLNTLRLSRSKACVLSAIIFTILHYALCKLLFNIVLAPVPAFFIFFSAIALNSIFILRGNILLTWAIHAGVNFSFFGGEYMTPGGLPLSDAEKFNLIYDSIPLLVFTVIFSVALFFRMRSSKR